MRVCGICKKGSLIQKCGAHRYGGGWAMRATKKRAVWKVNLHTVKVSYQGKRQTMRLCTKCLRRVKKQMKESVVEKTEHKITIPKVEESTPVATP
jgi:ribosomal protein L28